MTSSGAPCESSCESAGLPSPANEPLSLLSLTDDCFVSVLEKVSAPELLVLGAVCRHLRAALDDGAHWEGAFRRRFEPVARLLFRGEMPLPPVRELPAHGRGGACWRLHYRSFRRSWMEPGGHGRLLLCIHGRVYDATEYMLEHPGDPNVLRASAGRDATQAFEYVGHSQSASRVLQSLELFTARRVKRRCSHRRRAACFSPSSWLISTSLPRRAASCSPAAAAAAAGRESARRRGTAASGACRALRMPATTGSASRCCPDCPGQT